jgi:hypothetical protein
MKGFLSAFLLLTSFISQAQTINPAQAKKYMGEIVTVCGEVSSAQSSKDVLQHPTLLGFGDSFPHNNFSVVILEENLNGFSYDPIDLDKTNVCVTGTVVTIFGRPGIFVDDPSQIESSNGSEINLTYHQGSGN